MLKAVIFDMDGVLVDTEPIYIEIEEEFFSELGMDVGPEMAATFMGMTTSGMWKILKAKFNLEQSLDELVSMNGKRFFDELMVRDLVPMSGVVSLIEELKENNLKIVVGTSASSRRMDLILGKVGLNEVFDGRVCADDVVNGKPDPEVFLKAADKIGMIPEDCAVVEDSRNGVLAANGAGMKSIGLKSSPFVQDFSVADLVVDSVSELNVERLKGLW